MSLRRNILLKQLANSFKWLPYSYEYLYHDLIPQTINGKNVKNKARITTIEGNSEVVNQLCELPTSSAFAGWQARNGTLSVDSANIVSNTITTVGTQYGYQNQIFKLISHLLPNNHYTLLKAIIKSPRAAKFNIKIPGGNKEFDVSANTWTFLYALIQHNYVSGNDYYSIEPFLAPSSYGFEVGDVIQYKEIEMIDLTQAYPFDTPTSLDDPRVQKILNGGYIPYNTGMIKSVNVGTISSEPFNVWDEEWELGSINSSGVLTNSSYNFRSKNYIDILPNTTYAIYYASRTGTQNITYYFYDKDKNFISYSAMTSVTSTFTTPTNAYYLMFRTSGDGAETTYNHNICINRSSSLNGTYKPHTSSASLPFIYQGSGVGTAHDSLEITATEYVFTKNQTLTALSSLGSWSAYGGFLANYTYIGNKSTSIKPNFLCDKYQVVNMTYANSDYTAQIPDKSITVISNGNYLYIKDSSISSASEITGTLLNPITPQVTRIQKKHLGIVDLGKLSWVYDSSNQIMYTDSLNNTLLGNTTNLYCSLYMYDSSADSSMKNMTMKTSSVRLKIKNTSFTSANAFKSAMTGVYLFYETYAEVEDIDTQIAIEAGGTINANLFSWNKNQLLAKLSAGTTETNGITFVSNGDGSFTISGTATANIYKYLGNPSLKGKRILYGFFNLETAINGVKFSEGNVGWGTQTQAITNPITQDTNNFGIYIYSGTVISTPVKIVPQIVNLTLGFGAGNEPTSVDDPRIQYIIKNGYIPTDTIGTQTDVQCDVLPNTDFDFKCK